MTRAHEAVKTVLSTNKAGYSFLNISNIYYSPEKAFLESSFPLLIVQEVTQSGTAKGLGDYETINRILTQIDIYYPQGDNYETVSSTKYFGDHLLRKIATDVKNCLRTYLKTDTSIKGCTFTNERGMGIEEINRSPVHRRSLDLEVKMINSD